MITVISPAKRLDLTEMTPKIPATQPDFQADAISLANTARRLSVAKLQKLMSISQPLAKLNQSRFKAFEADPATECTKPAALVFAGDTYMGLEAGTLDADELRYAQDHLRILSGLYGLLRPMDEIQAYRLEMGSRLATRRGKSLYQYWGNRLAKELNIVAEAGNADFLLNCASVEYFTAVAPKALKPSVITPVFMETKDGKDKIVSFFAKKARGAMARYVVQNRIDQPEGVKDFAVGDYQFQPDQSEGLKLVFTRPYPEVA